MNHKEQDVVEGETGCHKQWEAEDTLPNKRLDISYPSKNQDSTSNLASLLLVKALNHQAKKYTPSLAKRYGRINKTTHRNKFAFPDQDKRISFVNSNNQQINVDYMPDTILGAV